MFWGSYKRPLIKFLLLFLFVISSLFIGLVASYQFTSVQTATVKYLASYISKKIGMPISVESVRINWLGEIVLNQVKILDRKGEILIGAKKIRARFNPITLFKNNNILLSHVTVDGADVRIVRHGPDEDFNINEFVDAINNLSGPGSSGSPGNIFIIQKSELRHSSFTYSDPFSDTLTDQFNYNQFRLVEINANLGKLVDDHGDFAVNVTRLSCTDSATRFPIRKLSCEYQITDTVMSFSQLNLDAGKSHIETSYVFRFKDQGDLSSFTDKVTILGAVNRSLIYSKDLALFAPYFKPEERDYSLEGKFNGQISNFSVKDFALQLNSGTSISGNLAMKGLPDFENTFIDLQVKNSRINAADLGDYIPEYSMETIRRFGQSSFSGRFTGFPTDFVAYASFYTQIGELESDINFKIPSGSDVPRYTGKLMTKDFDLGSFLNNESLFQKIDLNGYISGKGLSLNNMDFHLNADIPKFGIHNYDYTGITTNGRLATHIFEGVISIRDPNLKFSANANINLEKGKEKIKVVAKLDTAYLKPLNFTSRDAFLSTDLNIDFNGLLIDQLTGTVKASNTRFNYGDHGLTFRDFELNSGKTDSLREFALHTDFMNIRIKGNYNYTDVAKDIPGILKEYKILINNDSSEVGSYFDESNHFPGKAYQLIYEIQLIHINPLLHLFEPDISIADHSEINGTIRGGAVSELDLKSELDTLVVNKITFLHNNFVLNSLKPTGKKDVDIHLEINSVSQVPETGAPFKGLLFSLDWKNQKINSRFKIAQPQENNRIDLEATADLYPSYTVYRIIPVEFVILNEPWDISPTHYLLKKGSEFDIYDFLIFNKEQSINVYGSLSEDSTKSLNIGINNFKIENLNPILPKEFYGMVNGYVRIEGIYDRPKINSKLFIDSLVFEKFYVGNVKISSIWDHITSRFEMNLNVMKYKKQIIEVSGFYYPLNTANQLDLDASLEDANLNVIEPFYEDLISDLKGNASGQFRISGMVDAPVLKGTAKISGGNVTLDYLNTTYLVNGQIDFSEDEIKLNNLNLKDRYNNSGILQGSIHHSGFKNLTYNIKGTFKNLNLLNTSVKDNTLYYGIAYGTGDISITGQNDNISIGAHAQSNSGTRLFIPLNGTEEVHQENFIQFASLKNEKTNQVIQSSYSSDFSGIKLDLNLELTPDAYCEIIFDPTSGDIIRGKGNGKLSLQIDTKGVFNMFGEYEITEGSYNFTLYNIINKAFTIQPGSTITWSGDPYAATLDVTAEYKQLASLAPIFTPYVNQESDSAFYQSPEVKRKYPTSVKLLLKGPLMSPNIDFGIDIDYPLNLSVNNISFSTTISAFENQIQNNEQDLKRQVFSLIVLRRFDEGSFSVPTSVGNSVSEFISNQLSYWITQLDQNLQVNLDLGAIDQKAINTFQLTLSYSLAQGRLRITRAGNIYADQTNNDVSSIIGDWTLEYMLTRDGNLRAKMYNKFNANSVITNTLGGYYNSTGFSLMQTKGFDRFNELFARKNNSRKNSRHYTEYDEGVIPSDKTSRDQKNSVPVP